MQGRWYFAIEGDIHARVNEHGNPVINPDKVNPDVRFGTISKSHPLEFVLCIGDLTNHGYDGKGVMTCAGGDRKDDELGAFKMLYSNPMKEAKIPLYLCLGNHDMPPGRKGVGEWVQKRHSTTWPLFKSKWYGGSYTFKCNGVAFICLGVYPNDLKWLAENLPAVGTPIIIWYHYSTPIGDPFSDFWSTAEKFKFHDVISQHNVMAICNGHTHNTTIGMFCDIPVIRGSGKGAAVIEMDGDQLSGVYFSDIEGDVIKIERLAFYEGSRWNSKSQKKYDMENRNTPSSK